MATMNENTGNKETKVSEKPGFFAKIGQFFVRIGGKIKKFFKDTFGEMKKVVWTSKKDTVKNTELVVVTVIAFAIVIAVIDFVCSKGINALAGLLG